MPKTNYILSKKRMKNFWTDPPIKLPSGKTPKTTYFNCRGQKYFREKNKSLEYLFPMQHKALCDLMSISLTSY